MKILKKLGTLLVAALVLVIVHEGAHALSAVVFNEYAGFQVHLYGFEVLMRTPVAERAGAHWAVISGSANVLTVLLGYLVLLLVVRRPNKRDLTSAIGYWIALLGLLLDPLNLAFGPFLYGGDALGIAAGLQVPVSVVQIAALLVFLVNRELVAQKLLPAFELEMRHPLLQPWLRIA